MAKVLGVGGMFFKPEDPKRLYDWYARWLGMELLGYGVLPKDQAANGQTVWSAFPATTDYFAPSQKEFMFNVVVDDLEEALRQVEERGAILIGNMEKLEYGSFGWFMDPDGNKVGLWEPPK